MSWTDDRVETLKKLWNDGLSASQIAAQLGGVTRNAVIGKVHRLGLSGRAKPARKAIQRVKAPRQPNMQPRKPRTTHMAMGNVALKAEAQPQAERASGGEVIELPPTSKKLSIASLTERTCRWPIGDPTESDFHFCGCDVEEGSPYCSYHSKLAFQPMTQRKRVVNG